MQNILVLFFYFFFFSQSSPQANVSMAYHMLFGIMTSIVMHWNFFWNFLLINELYC